MQKMDENLKQLMLENIEAAQAIHSNYEPLLKETLGTFIKELKEKIKSKEPVSSSPDDWELKIYCGRENGLVIRNTKWIDQRKTSHEDHHLRIEWQNVSKGRDCRSTYGVVAHKDHIDRNNIKEKLDGIQEWGVNLLDNEWWPFCKMGVDFLAPNQLKTLVIEQKRTKLVKEIACKLIALMEFCNSKLLSSENSNS